MSEMKTLIDLLAGIWGGYDQYNERLGEEIALQIGERWYVAPARVGSDLAHALSVFGFDKEGQIHYKEDTGLCGNDAIVTRPRPIASGETKRVSVAPEGMLKFRWNAKAGQDGSRLFHGAFEQIE